MLCEHDHYHTILIDFENYRHAIGSKGQLTIGISSNQTVSKECAHLKNQEYRMCGKKCVLNCRHDSKALKFSTSNEKCDTNKCVEGCFCKDGFVRYHNECVPIRECPTRRNRAVHFATEMKTDTQMNIQNATQETSTNPKIFGFFNRRECRTLPCAGIPLALQMQQYDANIQRHEISDSGW